MMWVPSMSRSHMDCRSSGHLNPFVLLTLVLTFAAALIMFLVYLFAVS